MTPKIVESLKKMNENANTEDIYYIEAPEDEGVEKFDEIVTDFNLPHPESASYDFDNTYLASVAQIRAMIEEYGIEPVVYELFDEEEGPKERVYDVYSLVFDADPINECVCAGQACGTGTISDFVPEKMRGVKDIHEEDDKFVESKNKIKEAFDFEDDDDLGYDDFDYEGEMEDYFNPNVNEPNENSFTRMWADEYDNDVSDTGIPIVKSNIFGNDTDNLSDEYLDMAMTDTGEYKKGNTVYGSDLDNPVKTIDLVEKKNMITKTRIEESFKKVMETKEVPAENPNNYFYNSAEKNIEYSKVNPNNMKVNKKLPETKEVPAENPNNFYYSSEEDNIEYPQNNPNSLRVNKKLPESMTDFDDDYFETSSTLDANDFDERDDPLYGYGEDDDLFESTESQAMPRKMRESRALPGGMLNSEEKTAYEDFLRERHLKQDKVKAKEFGKNKLGLYDDDCGENGWHNWDGTKIERKR